MINLLSACSYLKSLFSRKDAKDASFGLTPRRKGRKGGLAGIPFIVFLIEYDGVKKISRKANRSLDISLGALCALA
jgi:hypothetical protein